METTLITGSSGLIGSEVSSFFLDNGYDVHGIDNNQRAIFFGKNGDTRWRQKELSLKNNFTHHELDIRDRVKINLLIKEIRPKCIVHTAAQPSHDLAASIPFDDFDINAVGTLNLLESCRQYCKDSPFIHMSTNKVYGDLPNINITEKAKRYDYTDLNGISETFSIDQSKHSLFGASKVAADIMVQEYGKYFDMPTCCLRCGCLTGPNHSGVELHGFLNYLIKCNLEEKEYTIFGYKGKQVRDNIHSKDVARFIYEFYKNPKNGEVYNLGGGKENSCSILEAFDLVESFTGKKQKCIYSEVARIGDHICYYSNLSKIRNDYPNWGKIKSLPEIVKEMSCTQTAGNVK